MSRHHALPRTRSYRVLREIEGDDLVGRREWRAKATRCLRAYRWIPHFSVYPILFGGTHTFRREAHFLALPPESTIRDPIEAPKTCSDTLFHARSEPCQKHNKPLEFLVLPSKTRNPRGPVRTHTFVSKVECRWLLSLSF